MRGLRSFPGDEAAPFLVVAVGDVEISLTVDEKRRLETEPYPYAVIRSVSGRPTGGLLSGVTEHAVTRDIYLEHRDAPDARTLTQLSYQVLRAVKLVDEYKSNWPLSQRFKLQNDPDVYSNPNDAKTLYCTLRYTGAYLMNLREQVNG